MTEYEFVGTMSWEQAKAVAETLGGGTCVWGWHDGKKSCYPTGSLELHSIVTPTPNPSGEPKCR